MTTPGDSGGSPDPRSAPPNATARAERHALAHLLLAVGPDAPTCCAGWTTRDLAAHLVVRERRPDASLGVLTSAAAGWSDRVRMGAARQDYARLVDQVRSGPPVWSVQRAPALDGATNTVEYFVHHEDVRRAQPGWEPRVLDDVELDQLTTAMLRLGPPVMRRSPVGVDVVPSDGPRAGEPQTLRGGDRTVTLRGPVGECVLAVYGRPTRGLELDGDPDDVAAFLAFPR